MRRTRQQHHRYAGLVDPLAGRGAAIVSKDLRALDDERLTLVDFRHLAAHLLETPLELIANILMEALLPIERQSYGVTRDVVFGRAEPAGDDDDLRAADGAANGLGKPLAVVTDHALGHH